MATSEQILNFPPWPEYQCPSIDNYQSDVDRAIDELKYCLRFDDIEDVREEIEEVMWILHNIKTIYLEDLREVCSDLRDVGECWKELCKELIKEYEPDLLEEDP